MLAICGPKSSGKSTFSHLLLNGLLSSSAGLSQGVAFLDLDPGQSEFSPPSQISLVYLRRPFFGPAFTHPLSPDPDERRIVRAHAIAAVSPQEDPLHFGACVRDLMNHYSTTFRPAIPLVVNFSSWLTAQGTELLLKLIEHVSPTNVIYMSEAGPPKVLESLQGLAERFPLHVLPAVTVPKSCRTAKELRAMQTLSYFHVEKPQHGQLRWSAEPLSRMEFWTINYGGEASGGVSQIVIVGRRVAAEHMSRVINGSTVALVAVERDVVLSDASAPLDPSTSHCVGHALVRGMDERAKTVQLLTPVERATLERLLNPAAEAKLVLLAGKTDTPAWAYLEDMHVEAHAEASRRRREGQGHTAGPAVGGKVVARQVGAKTTASSPWLQVSSTNLDLDP